MAYFLSWPNRGADRHRVRASQSSLIVRVTVSGRVPCSGASAGARSLTQAAPRFPAAQPPGTSANQPRGFFASAELALLAILVILMLLELQ